MNFKKDPLLSEKDPFVNGAMSVFGQEFTQDIYFVRAVAKDQQLQFKESDFLVPYTCRELSVKGKNYREEYLGVLSKNYSPKMSADLVSSFNSQIDSIF